ncbi:hypothetical protein H4J46_09340 [Colwellia sp. MB02u-6]|uniref:5-methylcytosine restriction system specificity protein McrC n=1 Tax=Colwellia sp. MB02u-6 TaxID=2759824 RepID=UPI0015F3F87D|nr:hypothetical protein [Colwellia sp. MB02u-6]MBA6328137.1 hypothetical protein [Colwellia sp. MB02u-6]
MERVFEDYVAVKFKEQLPEHYIQSQVRQHCLLTHTTHGSIVAKKLYQLRPDLHITFQSRIIIADTKWKLIDENLPSKKYNISEGDIYQMLAYNQSYQKNEDETSEIWLIYPLSEDFTKRIPDFRFDNGAVIKVIPFDIDNSLLL